MDQDGTMRGYDLELAKFVSEKVGIPLTFLGEAGSYNDFIDLANNIGLAGLSAGSLFVFKGKYRAVLINYPNMIKKEEIYKSINFYEGIR